MMFSVWLRAGIIPGFSLPAPAEPDVPRRLAGRRSRRSATAVPGRDTSRSVVAIGGAGLPGKMRIPVGISGKLLAFCPPSSSDLCFLPLPWLLQAWVRLVRGTLPRHGSIRHGAVALAGVGLFSATVSDAGYGRRGSVAALGTAAPVLPCPSSSLTPVGDSIPTLWDQNGFPSGSRLLPPSLRAPRLAGNLFVDSSKGCLASLAR